MRFLNQNLAVAVLGFSYILLLRVFQLLYKSDIEGDLHNYGFDDR